MFLVPPWSPLFRSGVAITIREHNEALYLYDTYVAVMSNYSKRFFVLALLLVLPASWMTILLAISFHVSCFLFTSEHLNDGICVVSHANCSVKTENITENVLLTIGMIFLNFGWDVSGDPSVCIGIEVFLKTVLEPVIAGVSHINQKWGWGHIF